MALDFDAETVSYGALARRVRSAARVLRREGVGPGDRVGLCFDRSVELTVAALATVEAGAAYVPLDPSYPEERIGFMIEDAGVRLVLAGSEAADALPKPLPRGVRRLAPAAGGVGDDGRPDRPLASAGASGPVAVYYTSGSTGRPKGVAVPARGVVRLVRDSDYLRLGPDDRVSSLSNTAFDAATFELWGPLLNGGTLVAVGRDTAIEPARLAAEIGRRRLGVAFLTTALFNQMAFEEAAGLGALRALLFGGEAADLAAVRAVVRAGGPETLINLYGPTESSTFSTWHEIGRTEALEESAWTVPIGRPIANTSVVVADRGLRAVPPGVAGELLIGGDGLASRYLGRPALTAERFVPDPFAAVSEPWRDRAFGARLYRTSDLVRRRRDGVIEFLGRADDQVKIRGFRIEPGEVEAVLAAHPDVAQAVVVARRDRSGELGLVGYAAPRGEAELTCAALRDYLRERLPAYLVPAAFVVLEALPLTPNGKIDRRALPEPEAAGPAARGHVAPRTVSEAEVARAFAEVLGVEEVGAGDSFFDLGGHSLKATRVLTRLRDRLGVDLPLRVLFERPVVAELAAAVDALGGSAAGPALERLDEARRAGGMRLSYAQERLWVLDRLDLGADTFSMPFAVRLTGELDVAGLAAALSTVVARHEVLRTVYRVSDEGPLQVVLAAAPASLPVIDLSGLAAAAREPALGDLYEQLNRRPFHLDRGPVFRAALVREESAGAGPRHVLHLSVHHIAADGWSIEILVEELGAAYAARREGRAPELPELPVQYGDFAVWQRRRLGGEIRERQLAYWRERLRGTPQGGSELPLDRPRPVVQSFRGERVEVFFEPELTAGLERLGLAHKASLFMVLLAAFKVVLARLGGDDDVVVGSPIAGRERAELERLIGIFLNSLVLRTDLGGEPTFIALLERVRETALGAFAHQEVPFEMLLEELRPERDLSRTPFFQVFFNMFRSPLGEASLPGLGLEAVTAPEPPSKFDLTLYLGTPEDRVRIDAVYNADLFDPATIERLLAQYRRVLEQVVARPEAEIGSYSLALPEMAAVLPDPRSELCAAWHGPIHGALERWAGEAPDRRAVAGPEGTWSYGALADRVRRLARRLAALGVAPGDRVAVYAHRSPALVWAVLGILEAGGAFVVLDPGYPAERLAETIRQAGAAVLLELAAAGPPPEALADDLRARGVVRLVLGPRGEELAGEDAAPLGIEVGPDDPAYVAFTSGSTGRPKGIVGRHGSLSHFLPWQGERFGLGAGDRFSMLSGLAHDPLHRDLFTPLWFGASLVVPDPAEMTRAGYLARWMAEEGVTVAHLTPAMGQVLTERPAAGARLHVASLRRAFLVGDVLTHQDVERLTELAPELTCINMYGSTETQRAVGFHELPPCPGGRRRAREVLPLGRGMEDVQLLVLGPRDQLAAVGEVGEIAVRSPHLALGYHQDPELTARRFAANPFTARPEDRIYRTGDLGRYQADGSVVFVGRRDDQVKVRGFRIEPGEIQARLAQVPGVREAVVLARDDGPGGRRLVAYVAADGTNGDRPTPEALRLHLAGALPAYMVPSGFAVLDRLPLTPNGKVDRRALTAVRDSALEAARASQPPTTDGERRIAAVLAEVLGTEELGVDANFFDLGGNSLLLVRAHARLEEALGIELPLMALFNHPSVRSLAAHLASREAPAPDGEAAKQAAERRAEQAERLSAGQRRLLARRRRSAP